MSDTDAFFVPLDLEDHAEVGKMSDRVAEKQEKSAAVSLPDTHFGGRSKEKDIPKELNDVDKTKFTFMLLEHSSVPSVRTSSFDNPKQRIIIRFSAPEQGISQDVEVPLDISCNDLVMGLNEAYHLGIDTSDDRQTYLICENPIALLKGKKLLGEIGVRDGSVITFSR